MPRDKICGDGMTFLTLPKVREIFPEVELPTPASQNPVVTAHVPFGRRTYQVRTDIDVIPRLEFDHLLWRAAARAGAVQIEEAVVDDVLRAGDRVVGVIATIGGERVEIKGRLIVGADGSSGVIRRKTGDVSKDHVIMAVRQYVRGIPAPKSGLEFFFEPDGNGYFWMFPFRRGNEWWANIGYGADVKLPPKLLRRFRDWLDEPRIKNLLGSGELLGKLVAYPLHLMKMRGPYMAPARNMYGSGYVLVGDAAGLIHPYSGEGISFALESGAQAALCYSGDWESTESLCGVGYQKELLRHMGPTHESWLAYLALKVPQSLPRWVVPTYFAALTLAVRAVKLGLRPLFQRWVKGSELVGQIYGPT